MGVREPVRLYPPSSGGKEKRAIPYDVGKLCNVYEFFRDARYIAYNVPVRIIKRRRTDIVNNLI